MVCGPRRSTPLSLPPSGHPSARLRAAAAPARSAMMKTLSNDERTDLHPCGHFECVQMLSLLCACVCDPVLLRPCAAACRACVCAVVRCFSLASLSVHATSLSNGVRRSSVSAPRFQETESAPRRALSEETRSRCNSSR
ncbi:hypothetical protein ABB37_06152 [Leptomonas pyrrhocoris]|uniref:Uncharacterized protein n=1 Tax=Leptomonas pyrrhocoris TaxID=157538 RepID=A0A0N0VEJ7_LEPPY|nr:hypothetical protein ABB37_06152 [Leptomonas pyrrhocoris]KPA78552.1 hypothetical protein ABB37_06152 [Leptomonas pyrrhocoris]|eukprot:XP_015656991.1 hypothetical protein ABB37_06152 [Leptomonas pyrrhocoris]